MNSTKTLQSAFLNDRDIFLDTLGSYVVLDIGTIEDINEQGRARVVSSTFMNNKPIVYEDAEIIFPGNANGTFAASGRNMACLIFIPRSCMPTVDNLVLEIGKPSYNKDGVKAMPIGNGAANNLKMHYSDGGDLSLLGRSYNVDFTNDTIILSTKDSKTMLTMDGTGQLFLSRQTDNGSYFINVEDGIVTRQWLNANKDVLWTDTYNQDGSRTFVQSNPNDEEADPFFSMTIAADGTITFNGLKPASINITGDVDLAVTDGDVNVTADNITLNGDDKRLVTYAELKAAMDKLWVAMTTTPIAGNGSTQPSWTGITSIDISASETQTIKTGG